MNQAKQIIDNHLSGTSNEQLLEDDLLASDKAEQQLSREDLSFIVESVCIDLYASLQLLRLNTPIEESRNKVDVCISSLNTILEQIKDI